MKARFHFQRENSSIDYPCKPDFLGRVHVDSIELVTSIYFSLPLSVAFACSVDVLLEKAILFSRSNSLVSLLVQADSVNEEEL